VENCITSYLHLHVEETLEKEELKGEILANMYIDQARRQSFMKGGSKILLINYL